MQDAPGWEEAEEGNLLVPRVGQLWTSPPLLRWPFLTIPSGWNLPWVSPESSTKPSPVHTCASHLESLLPPWALSLIPNLYHLKRGRRDPDVRPQQGWAWPWEHGGGGRGTLEPPKRPVPALGITTENV